VAFFGKHHRLSLVRVRGGRVRSVGRLEGSTLDWQPLPATPAGACLSPPGSVVVATSSAAIISRSRGFEPVYPYGSTSADLGCLRADGRTRLLSSDLYPGYSTSFGATQIALAGPYVAFGGTAFNSHDQTMDSVVNLFDLRDGMLVPNRGTEHSGCYSSPPCTSTIDELVLGSDAVSAVHETVSDNNCWAMQPDCRYTLEQIQANDSTGTHILDSVTEPDGSPPALTNLTLTGDTLTWAHYGVQRSTHLQP
jgi:hypothetical protein